MFFHTNIEKDVRENNNYRKVLFTGKFSQVVMMTLLPGQDIGLEVHEDHDQFFRFEEGQGKVVLNDESFPVGDGDATVAPAGVKHNVINTSTTKPLKLYTIYAPPEHPPETTHATKKDAHMAED